MKPVIKLLCAATCVPLSIIATSPAFATSCTFPDDSVYEGATRKYEDTTLKQAFYDAGGSESAEIVKFYVMNYSPFTSIDDIQMLLFCDGMDVARTVRGPDINGYFYTKANTAAIFDLPWVDGCRLQTEIRWKGYTHYQRVSDSYNGEDNGISVKAADTGMESITMHDCK
ncbi:hypothetical protein [Pseudoruegeria sp. HB172150]|uniref:hypothetical protein n=1 Tax=Pseudoruegeria sp. HB172150 TaxID=2721164 RepID=UPI001552F0CC|nr:hypothetical protein [Pseudoruegeria sp. HB172150]